MLDNIKVGRVELYEFDSGLHQTMSFNVKVSLLGHYLRNLCRNHDY
jgi:hypothetical protein